VVLKGQGGGHKRGNYFFLHLYIGKNLLKRNILQISIKLGTNISCLMGIQVYSNKVQVLFKEGIITKVQK
jgi:hypothetical protein